MAASSSSGVFTKFAVIYWLCSLLAKHQWSTGIVTWRFQRLLRVTLAAPMPKTITCNETQRELRGSVGCTVSWFPPPEICSKASMEAFTTRLRLSKGYSFLDYTSIYKPNPWFQCRWASWWPLWSKMSVPCANRRFPRLRTPSNSCPAKGPKSTYNQHHIQHVGWLTLQRPTNSFALFKGLPEEFYQSKHHKPLNFPPPKVQRMR